MKIKLNNRKRYMDKTRVIHLMAKTKYPNQVVGNAGLYYVCYELSKIGWNVMPTSRNAKGVDIIIYSQNAKRTHTIQVKSLSRRTPVPLGNKLPDFIAEFLIICRNVFEDPEAFIINSNEIKNRIHEGVKDNKKSYWLQPKDYEEFKNKWEKIGNGNN